MFRLMTLMQPKGVEEQDSITRQLTSPNPCKDPGAALKELKKWFMSIKRAADIGMTMPSLELLYRGARSIYSGAFEGDDFHLRLRWTNVEAQWGFPHQLSHEGLRAINEFAEAELSAMVIAGRNGGTTGLPLTETQRQREKGEKEAERTRRQQEKNAKGQQGPKAASVMVGNERYSNTHAIWAQPCTHWASKGFCTKGIACLYKHEGFKLYDGDTPTDRCIVCGQKGHSSTICKAPGGGADPNKAKVWKEYKELAQKKKEEKEKGQQQGGKGEKGDKGKGKGKNKGDGKGDKGKGKGKGKGKEHQQQQHSSRQ